MTVFFFLRLQNNFTKQSHHNIHFIGETMRQGEGNLTWRTTQLVVERLKTKTHTENLLSCLLIPGK